MKLKKIDDRPNEIRYKAENGDVYLLRKKDHRRGENSPEYYLMIEAEPKNKYLSGVFRTAESGVFSLDIKDSIGMREKYTFKITQDGAELTKD
jgi:hypothetical protein